MAVKKTKKKRVVTKLVEIPKDAKIVVLNTENPRRRGTGAHRRAQAVLLSQGQTVETAIKKGAHVSTIRHLMKEKIVRLAGSKPAGRRPASSRAA